MDQILPVLGPSFCRGRSPETIASMLVINKSPITAKQLTNLLGFVVSADEADSFIDSKNEKAIYQKIKKLIDEKTNTGWTSGVMK